MEDEQQIDCKSTPSESTSRPKSPLATSSNCKWVDIDSLGFDISSSLEYSTSSDNDDDEENANVSSDPNDEVNSGGVNEAWRQLIEICNSQKFSIEGETSKSAKSKGKTKSQRNKLYRRRRRRVLFSESRAFLPDWENLTEHFEEELSNTDDQNKETSSDTRTANFEEENYCIDWEVLTEEDWNSWNKYWDTHGERIVWDSWVEQYRDYLNPEYSILQNLKSFRISSDSDESENSCSEYNNSEDCKKSELKTLMSGEMETKFEICGDEIDQSFSLKSQIYDDISIENSKSFEIQKEPPADHEDGFGDQAVAAKVCSLGDQNNMEVEKKPKLENISNVQECHSGSVDVETSKVLIDSNLSESFDSENKSSYKINRIAPDSHSCAKSRRKRRGGRKHKRKIEDIDGQIGSAKSSTALFSPKNSISDDKTTKENEQLWQEEYSRHSTEVYQIHQRNFLEALAITKSRNAKKKAKKKFQSFEKYYHQRYTLFARFDEGIQLDEESWFSVTPEQIACHIAQKYVDKGCGGVVVDAFCGCGGNTIQFANLCQKVIAIDIDPVKVEFCKNNAKIYGVEDKIEFIVGDFLEIAASKQLGDVDAVFLSPPWGGPCYISHQTFDIHRHIPNDGFRIFQAASNLSPNIAFFLPRNVNFDQVVEMAGETNFVEIERNYINDRVKTITAYYGKLADKPKPKEPQTVTTGIDEIVSNTENNEDNS